VNILSLIDLYSVNVYKIRVPTLFVQEIPGLFKEFSRVFFIFQGQLEYTVESERSHSVADSYSIMSLQAQSGAHVYI
jgi:hypothetical protein